MVCRISCFGAGSRVVVGSGRLGSENGEWEGTDTDGSMEVFEIQKYDAINA